MRRQLMMWGVVPDGDKEPAQRGNSPESASGRSDKSSSSIALLRQGLGNSAFSGSSNSLHCNGLVSPAFSGSSHSLPISGADEPVDQLNIRVMDNMDFKTRNFKSSISALGVQSAQTHPQTPPRKLQPPPQPVLPMGMSTDDDSVPAPSTPRLCWEDSAPPHHDLTAYQLLLPFLQATMGKGNTLDNQLKARNGVEQVPWANVCFTSRPIAAALGKWQFQIVAVLVAILWASTGLYALVSSYTYRNGSVRFLKFAALEARDGRKQLSTTGIERFGIFCDGCPFLREVKHSMHQNTTVVEYNTSQGPHSGLFFVTCNDSAAHPVRFEISSSTDGIQWNLEATAVMHHDWMGEVLHRPGTRIPPRNPFSLVQVSLKPSIIWILSYPVFYLAAGVSLIVAVIMGRIGREKYCKTAMLLPMLWACVILPIASITAAGSYERATYLLTFIVTFHFMIRLGFFEKHLAYTFVYQGVLESTVAGINSFILESRNVYASAIWGFSMIGLGVLVLLLRRRTVQQTRQLVNPDRVQYQELWDTILQDQKQNRDLHELKQEIAKIGSRLPGSAIQRDRPAKLGVNTVEEQACLFLDPSKCMDVRRQILKRVDSGTPITSLDQLMAQADVLHQFLIKKVEAWSLASNGMFPVAVNDSSMDGSIHSRSSSRDCRKLKKWTDLVRDEHMRSRVIWAQTKGAERAIDKVLRVYKGDPSRLCDCARQSIVFDNVRDLLDCIRAINTDQDVLIVRMKNRLDPEYDSGLSAGYRNVAINLQIVTPETVALRCEQHICEVQCLLRQFAEVKSEHGHCRYIRYLGVRAQRLRGYGERGLSGLRGLRVRRAH